MVFMILCDEYDYNIPHYYATYTSINDDVWPVIPTTAIGEWFYIQVLFVGLSEN
jgi:hypothetical protein